MQFEIANGNLKKTWNLINSLRGKQSKSNTTSFIVGSKTVENAQDVFNEFNKFFNSIAKKMNAKVFSSEFSTAIDSKGFREYLNNGDKITSSMFMEDCSETEIEEIIMNLENDKASDITIRVLKKCSKYISEHLMKFFNCFMTNGSFPTILKNGSITPIYKKGDSRYMDNYRPVSTLSIFGKIFEKVLYCRFYNFLLSKDVIYEKQFGFRKNHSTSHAINYSVNMVLSQLEAKNIQSVYS